MPIILSNDFHNTKTTVRAEVGDFISHARLKAIKARLCGAKGCTCSGSLGTRGKQADPSIWIDMDQDQEGGIVTREDRR